MYSEVIEIKKEDASNNPVEAVKLAFKLSDTPYTEKGTLIKTEGKLIKVLERDNEQTGIIVENEVDTKIDIYIGVFFTRHKYLITGWFNNNDISLYSHLQTGKRIIESDVFRKISEIIPIEEVSFEKTLLMNRQKAENLSRKEMTSPEISMLLHFCRDAGVDYEDINSKNLCNINGKITKVVISSSSSSAVFMGEQDTDFDQLIIGYSSSRNIELVGFIEKEKLLEIDARFFAGKDKILSDKKVRTIDLGMIVGIDKIIPVPKIYSGKIHIAEKQNYVPLHCHSQFSIGDAFGTPEHISKMARSRGFSAMAITDHGTLGGLIYMQKALLEQEVKPILGVEAYVIEGKRKNSHVTILVKNEIGWNNLLKLNEIAVRDRFYYRPRLEMPDILKHKEGLILLSGCRGGIIAQKFFKDEKDVAEERIKILKEELGDDFYVEVMPHDVDAQIKYNYWVSEMADKYGIKIVITTDSHYSEREEIKYHEAVRAVGQRKKYGEAGYDTDTYYLLKTDEIEELFAKSNPKLSGRLDEFFLNTIEVSDKCNYEITPPDVLDTLPTFLVPDSIEKDFNSWLKNKPSSVVKLIIGDNKRENYEAQNLLMLFLIDKSDRMEHGEEFLDRLKVEYNRITGKHYTNYFLLGWDYIQWCNKNDVMVGPGRGSVGGSLLAYVIRITNVNPMEFGLIFERFISEIRIDMPDIDMDFEDSKRQSVFEYINNKYGENHCAKIATFSTWHAKGALRDVGRMFNIPNSEINRVSSLVVTRSGGDARANFCLEDTLLEFEQATKFYEKYKKPCEIAMKLEGHIRHFGVHAAGYAVTNKPIAESVPISKRGGEIITAWDWREVEYMKIVKLDILGLKTLSVISDTMASAKIESLPEEFDDLKVYDTVFKNGDTLGIFQFETEGNAKLSKQLGIQDFKTLYHANTLCRPGPLHSGETNEYIMRHKGEVEWEYPHELLEPITKETQGLILFQEQVMRVMYDLGGFSWSAAEAIRKVITKSRGQEMFEEMRGQFVTTASERFHLDKKEATRIFNVVCRFGSYGFNMAHSVEYSIIGYWCAWLKTYYPVEFYTSLLTHESDNFRLSSYMLDAEKNGMKILLPDVNKSKSGFVAEGKNIRIGLLQIYGIGAKTVKRFIREQPYSSFRDFIKRGKPTTKMLETLGSTGAFDCFDIPRKYIFENAKTIKSMKEFNFETMDEWDEKEKSLMANKYVALPQSEDIIKSFEDPFSSLVKYERIGEMEFKEFVRDRWIKGVVSFINFKQEGLEGDWTMFDNVLERRYAHLNVGDGTGNVLVHLAPEQYTYYKDILERVKGIPVVIKGHSIPNFGKIYCDSMIVLDDIDEANPILRYFDDDEKIIEELKDKNRFAKIGKISTVTYKVSKNKKPYARITTKEGDWFMVFKLTPDIFIAGETILYSLNDRFAKIIERRK